MSTERRTTVSKLMHSKWMLPGFSVLIGLVYLGAAIVGGDARLGVVMLAVMVVFALAVLLAGITPENLPGEGDFGGPTGKELL